MTNIATQRFDSEPSSATSRTSSVEDVRPRRERSESNTLAKRPPARGTQRDRVDLSERALAGGNTTATKTEPQDARIKTVREGDAAAVELRDGDRLLSTAPLTPAEEDQALAVDPAALDDGSAEVADALPAALGRDDEDDEVAQGEDVYGLLRALQEDSEDPLGLAQKEEERLFGDKKDPFAALNSQDEKPKEPPPPLPVVGVRMDFGAPAYAPLVVGEDPLEELYGAPARANDSGILERPIGLNGPFTVSTAQDEAADPELPLWMNASTKTDAEKANETPFAWGTKPEQSEPWNFGQPSENADPLAATSAAEKEKNAANAGAREALDFGLSDRTRVQLGTSPRRSTSVRTGGGETAFANSVGPLDGADRFRLQPAQEGPFGSLGNVAKVVSAYLRQASARTEAAGGVLSTLG